MKRHRHNAILDLVRSGEIASQEDLMKGLKARNIDVSQSTLSRDIHELHLLKGPGGYSLPGRNGIEDGTFAPALEDDSPPSVTEVMESFGLRVRQAMNQVLIGTVMGGAQPVAAALDHEAWQEVLGTLAGDDTVLVICPDARRASEVESRLRTMLES